MDYLIYSKDNCPNCEKAKNYIKLHGDTFTEIKIGKDISREEFMEIFPGVRSVPYIVYNQVVIEESIIPHYISSFDALRSHYSDKLMVKERQGVI